MPLLLLTVLYICFSFAATHGSALSSCSAPMHCPLAY
uniref:Uncharacterized protein n=1 Tax=Anguilla anguilla TaxID=7936 RepID=A0A0E9QUH9_ANGAN